MATVTPSTVTPRPSRRPPVAAPYMRPSCVHCYSIAAAHAGRVTYAGHNRRNRYQAGLLRPAPGSTRPTRRAGRGHPFFCGANSPATAQPSRRPRRAGHPLPWSFLAALAEKMRPAVTVRRYNRPDRRGGRVELVEVTRGRVELVGRVNVNPDRPKQGRGRL